jgi:hypothetical protein
VYPDSDRQFPHHNECPECRFLGNHDGWDLYYCKQEHSKHPVAVLLAVNPNERHIPLIAHESWHCEHSPLLAEALKRAKEAGCTLPDRRDKT